MYPHPDYDRDHRRLIRTNHDEAIDLTTGEKYRLQKVSDTDFGAGAMFGLMIAVILLLLLA